jgi:hypothetical protein
VAVRDQNLARRARGPELTGGGDRRVDEHRGQHGPSEGLPVRGQPSSAPASSQNRFAKRPRLQSRTLNPPSPFAALGVNGFMGGDDPTSHHGAGLDNGELADLRAVPYCLEQ